MLGSGFMHAAITMQRTKPKSQQDPIDMRMPYGTAIVALAASSAYKNQHSTVRELQSLIRLTICTHESKAPIVLDRQ